jgi:hypothetical protein
VSPAAIAATPTAADDRNKDRRDNIEDFTFSMMQALHMADVSFVVVIGQNAKRLDQRG